MKRNKIFIFVILVILGLTSACGKEVVLYSEGESVSSVETIASQEVLDTTAIETIVETDRTIMVHICGAVKNPGVYEIPRDARVFDAVMVAGGFKEDACEDYVNLAETIEDGCKIVIPTKMQISEEEKQNITEESFQAVIRDTKNSDSSDLSLLVNINTADEDKLKTLTGIGDTRAKSIIAYREEHGEFHSIEEIMNVSGIKDASYQKIKDEITVK